MRKTMELDEAIKGRRSIRSYRDQPVPFELVHQVLEAGTWAPSAKNGQQWRLTVFTGAAKKRLTDLFRSELENLEEKIGRAHMGSSISSCGIMERAPVLIMVWNAGMRRCDSEAHSVSAAIQNMLLKAYDLGLGSLWIADIYYAHEKLTRYLGKPWKLMAAVALGWPTSTPMLPPRKSVEEISKFLR